MADQTLDPYSGWSRRKLIDRIRALEKENNLGPSAASTSSTPPLTETLNTTQEVSSSPENEFDFSKHSRRKIALKFCYSGWEYCGLAYQLGPTPLPTVENVLFDVLAQTRLVDKEAGFEGCGWEKCGRTDRGVSAAGQVVSLWVRSRLPSGEEEEVTKEEESTVEVKAEDEDEDLLNLDDDFQNLSFGYEPSSANTSVKKRPKSEEREHDYVYMINRLLPPTIRVIAWSPVSPTFSARFSCKYRHYKYFFSSRNLNIPTMQAAAARLVGEHDFRNLCKLDVQKQITSFQRTILRASVEPIDAAAAEDDTSGRMYVFDLVGSAFLYHQVRHIVAVLFLIGSGLEPVSMITELMNVREGAEPLHPDDAAAGKTSYAVMDRKPEYQMADALPLMLWDCAYDESELEWRISNAPPDGVGEAEETIEAGLRGDLVNQLQSIHNRSRVYTALDQHFLRAAQKFHPSPPTVLPLKNGLEEFEKAKRSGGGATRHLNIPVGGGTFLRKGKYVSLEKRKRLDPVEVANERWRLKEEARKGGPIKIVEDDGEE
ncbi:pseudouridine synthase [Agrocybe pediades]|nr:pseudouridine synthase [Agrocybe pediades]